MKIIFVIRGLHDPGGIERVTCVLANGLVERGYEIGIACLEQGTPFFALKPTVAVHYLPANRLRRTANLKKLYAKEHPDVVVFVGSHRLLMNIPAAKNIPSIMWEHFNAYINWHPLHKLSRRLGVKHCHKIVTLTQQDVVNYTQLFGAENVICIPNPVTIPNIEPTPLTENRVLAVGRLASQKGFDLLLDAWAKTKQRQNGWKLRIIGSGRHLKRLQEQLRRNNIEDSVEMLPTTKEMVKQYKEASIFAMSSRYEGLPLVLIEAMAAGLPIVSFDCQTGPAEVVDPEKTGTLVPPCNTDALAYALDDLMSNSDKRQQFSENALERAKLFEPANIVMQWVHLFEEIGRQKGLPSHV